MLRAVKLNQNSDVTGSEIKSLSEKKLKESMGGSMAWHGSTLSTKLMLSFILITRIIWKIHFFLSATNILVKVELALPFAVSDPPAPPAYLIQEARNGWGNMSAITFSILHLYSFCFLARLCVLVHIPVLCRTMAWPQERRDHYLALTRLFALLFFFLWH